MLNEWGLNAHPAVIPNPPTTKRFLGASIGALAGAFVGTLVLNPIAGAALGAGLGGYLSKPSNVG